MQLQGLPEWVQQRPGRGLSQGELARGSSLPGGCRGRPQTSRLVSSQCMAALWHRWSEFRCAALLLPRGHPTIPLYS